MLRSPKCHYLIIVACLVGTSLIIASAVTKGFEHSKRHDELLNKSPYVKEEKAKAEEKEKGKDWWAKENGSGDTDTTNGGYVMKEGHEKPPAHTKGNSETKSEEKTDKTPAIVTTTEEELEQLSYHLSDAYLPIWFDRNSGWDGHSYNDAMEFCQSHDNFVPCPYEVYCPGAAGRVIFDEFMEEDGNSWAPILDSYNGWVQVGSGGDDECKLFKVPPVKMPNWWLDGPLSKGEAATRHIMCCLEHPLDDRFATLEIPVPHNEYEYGLAETYQPRWFDRSTGWEGQSYKEATEFCKSQDDFALCPYEVYCLYFEGLLVFGKRVEQDGEQWAPINDSVNEWVQIGNGAKQCAHYSEIYGEKPRWTIDGEMDNEEMTRNVMCCRDPNMAIENGERVEDPANPTPPSDVTGMDGGTTGSSFSASPDDLTTLDKEIMKNYVPYWFDIHDGWEGTTWDDSKEFCNQIPFGPNGETFNLCPAKAYCPNGLNADHLLFVEIDFFDEGLQWAPVSNNFNGWVAVGTSACKTYLELHGESPKWGLDGSQPETKKHILCCQAESRFEGTNNLEPASQTPIQGLPAVQIMPTNMTSSSQNISQQGHTGAGNSSPQTVIDTVTAMKMTLHPKWYSSTEGGWTGGSHDDAVDFCYERDQELCPIAAVCPHGPTFPALDGAFLTSIDETMDQWVPTINRPNQWVLIGTLDEENESTHCMEYYNLNGNKPQWGLDGSMPELKRHILCCANLWGREEHGQDNYVNGNVETPNLSSQTSAEASSVEWQDPTDQSIIEDLERPAMIGAIWFKVENGWNGGSHDDAVHFCALKEINHQRMELCPYHAYCPQGPSRPPVSGHGGEIGSGEHSTEQWAPSSNGDNQWVMVGMHGHNKATQCLTHGQLNGSAPSWGLDASNNDKKQHIMCCTLPE